MQTSRMASRSPHDGPVAFNPDKDMLSERVREVLTSYKGDVAAGTVPLTAPSSAVTRKIHQTFPTKSLPLEIQENVDRILTMNPGWKYQLYDDDDIEAFLDLNYGSSVLAYYRKIDRSYGASRADLFRYLLLYREGGVYLDIKSTATRPFDEILQDDDRYLLSYWENGPDEEFTGAGIHHDMPGRGEFQQWFIVAAAGHPYLLAVISAVLQKIRRYNPILHGVGAYGVLRLTGPVVYTNAIRAIQQQHAHRLVNSRQDIGLRYSIYRAVHNDNAHQAVFRNHYSKNTAPIVVPSAMDRLVCGAFKLMLKLCK